MLYYRLYFLDRFSGRIDRFRDFEAPDDDSAAVIAEAWSDGRAMELWNRSRKLRSWDAAPDHPPADS